jgi:DNA-binding transcriptional LysR family regulator
MDVRHMRQVLAIHRHGSFAKAAEAVGVAQPTLSKSIARLEDELGVQLFERSGAGARATPMGALIVARAETIVNEAERLTRDIELTASGQIGEARIGFGPALRAIFLPRFTEALATRRRSLRLSLSVLHRDRLIADLEAGAVDLAIMARADELDDRDYVQIEVLRDPAIAVVSPTHPLARLDHVPVTEFARYPHASGSPSSMLKVRGARGEDTSDLRHESLIMCNDDATLKMLAIRGLATLIIQRHLVREELESGCLVALPMNWRLNLSVTATMTRAASHSPILREIVELAQAVGRDVSLETALPPLT